MDEQSNVSPAMHETVRASRQTNALHDESLESEDDHSSEVIDDELNADEFNSESEADSGSDSESEQSVIGLNMFYSFLISLLHLYKYTRFRFPPVYASV